MFDNVQNTFKWNVELEMPFRVSLKVQNWWGWVCKYPFDEMLPPGTGLYRQLGQCAYLLFLYTSVLCDWPMV